MQQELKQLQDKIIPDFITKLKELSVADKAILKRNAGSLISESRGGAIGTFYKILPYGIPRSQEEIWFAVATLFTLNKAKLSEDDESQPDERTNFGWTLRRSLREKDRGENQDIKVHALLDSRIVPESDYFFHQVRRFVRLAYSKDVPVNWEKLLLDLINWNHPSRFVQKSWARAYFQNIKEE